MSERIARETLDIPFVHRRKVSGGDFYEVAVWTVATPWRKPSTPA
ncbi:hypothetical protein [Magnetospirillum sulfuroxidans]|nr:hypothetical protein [Magnetospirillum sulfuroxidans]